MSDANTAAQRIAVLGTVASNNAEILELLQTLGLEAVEVEAPAANAGPQAFDKLEDLRGVQFAVVLPAPDATGTLLALGFLLGCLDRRRICFAEGAVSPWDGAMRVSLDDGGLWRLLLAREMKRAGLDVDLNRAI